MLQQIEPSEIVATLRENLLVLTEDLVVEYANDRFFETFEVDPEETIGVALADLGNGQWNIPGLIEPLGRILDDHTTLEDYEAEHTFEHIGRRVMRLNARKTIRPGNGSRRILVAIEDVTEAVDAARAAERAGRLAEGIVATVRGPLLVLDGDLKVVTASRSFYQTFEVEEADTVGRRLWDLGEGQWAVPELIHLLTAIIPSHSEVDDFEVTHDFPEIGRRTILLNARKIFRQGNNTKTLLLAMEDVTVLRAVAAEREAALDRATRLLDELNHRVMNSLTMIGSIIAIEGRALSDAQAKAAFERMRRRIVSVAALYQNLSRAGSVETVEATDYLASIMRDVAESVRGDGLTLDLDFAIEPVDLSTDLAVPLGLIVNELATNSLKYAYADRTSGRLGIRFARNGDDLDLTVWDDGVGIDPEARVDSGIGQKLTAAFTKQLAGTSHVESDAEGTRFRLTMPATRPDRKGEDTGLA